MADCSHVCGTDLTLTPTGDLAMVAGVDYGLQRVLRRLLTNPGDYVWHGGYGAGLPAFVGEVVHEARITAVIRRQMRLERRVGQQPPPDVAVSQDHTGHVGANIRYADVLEGSQVAVRV